MTSIFRYPASPEHANASERRRIKSPLRVVQGKLSTGKDGDTTGSHSYWTLVLLPLVESCSLLLPTIFAPWDVEGSHSRAVCRLSGVFPVDGVFRPQGLVLYIGCLRHLLQAPTNSKQVRRAGHEQGVGLKGGVKSRIQARDDCYHCCPTQVTATAMNGQHSMQREPEHVPRKG